VKEGLHGVDIYPDCCTIRAEFTAKDTLRYSTLSFLFPPMWCLNIAMGTVMRIGDFFYPGFNNNKKEKGKKLPVFRIHDILGWIRILGSMLLTNGSGSGSWVLLFSSLTLIKKNFDH
jgi:hypothetical protein